MTPNEAADRLAEIKAVPQGAMYRAPATMLRALKKFRMMNGPSSADASILISDGDFFSLDGDEPGITVEGLIREGYAEVADLT